MDLADLTWPAVAALPRTTPIVFPVAAVEQHGRHMPLGTDAMLLNEVVRRVKVMPVAEKCVFAPSQWLGNSHHHIDFPGTLSASPRVYLDLIKDLANNVLAHGFTRLVFLNGHGGNAIPLQQALFELRQDHRDRPELLLLSLTYWDTVADPLRSIPGLSQGQMGHACEWETSMVLRLRPELVGGDLLKVPEVPFGTGFAPGHRAWVTSDRSPCGHVGVPANASPEKGEFLFRSFASSVAGYLERVAAWDGVGWDAPAPVVVSPRRVIEPALRGVPA